MMRPAGIEKSQGALGRSRIRPWRRPDGDTSMERRTFLLGLIGSLTAATLAPRRGGAIASAIACAANTVGSCRSLRRRRGQREQPRRCKNRVFTILSTSRPTRLSPLCQAPLQTLYAASTKVLAARTLVLLLSQPRAHQRRVARACSVAGSRPCPSMPSEADQRRPQHYRQQLRRTLPRRAPFGEAPFGRRRCISIKGEIAQ